jgi:hypothetical protein
MPDDSSDSEEKQDKRAMKNGTVQRLCRLLVDMPIGPLQFGFVSDELITRLPHLPIIGSWNMRCCFGFHEPEKYFMDKIDSLADLIRSEEWHIVALQELPAKHQALKQLEKGGIFKGKLESLFKGKLENWEHWRFQGCAVGSKQEEVIGFAFNSSMWTCAKVVLAQNKDQFKRSPVQAVFTSCLAVPTGGVTPDSSDMPKRRCILALSSVHLKPRDEDALSKTRKEVASLVQVGRQLKDMAAEQLADEKKALPLSADPFVICAILGDFNLAPIFRGDTHTDPRDPEGGPHAWTRLEEEGFNPVVSSTSDQATNAYETMLGQEGHCFDNCLPHLVGAAEAGLRLQTTWNLAPYPSHLPNPDDMQKVKDTAQSFEDAIGNEKMLKLMGEKTVSTLRQELEAVLTHATTEYRNKMLDHTSDHRALTFKFGIEPVKPIEGEGE